VEVLRIKTTKPPEKPSTTIKKKAREIAEKRKIEDNGRGGVRRER